MRREMRKTTSDGNLSLLDRLPGRGILALAVAGFCCLALLLVSRPAQAWDEEKELYFYEPWLTSGTLYTGTEVSSVHFDLVGALALAAGFSVTDAATIQIYSQLTDAGIITGSQVYSPAAWTSFPVAPPITTVVTSTICPSPATTAPTVTMGSTALIECPGCFTSRFGPFGVFFHMPHDSPDELGAIHGWAFQETESLAGKVTFGYSSTARFEWQGIGNIYETTPCFVQQTVTVDTGPVAAGSLEALGIYLHSLGDHWSHQECIAAADAAGKPFAAHVYVAPGDPLAPCRWLMHEVEFGASNTFPASNRTFSGTLAVYEALVNYAATSSRPLYRSIPLTAEGNHLYDTLYTFVHTATANNPQPRRDIANALRAWSVQTRATNPAYWLYRLYLPLILAP